MNREELLDTIRGVRSEFDSALAGLSEAQMHQPVLNDGWSVKDALAHIGWWEQRGATLFRTFSAGETPAEIINDDNIDEINERIYQQYKDMPLDEVRAFEQSSYRDILLLVETVPEEDLFDPNRFPALGHEAVDLIIFNTSDHYIEHLETMRGEVLDLVLPCRGAAGRAKTIIKEPQRWGSLIIVLARPAAPLHQDKNQVMTQDMTHLSLTTPQQIRLDFSPTVIINLPGSHRADSLRPGGYEYAGCAVH